jgi:FtsH-binding integral membrane protein
MVLLMSDEITPEQYLREFAGTPHVGDRQKEALKQALDIRKFEIDLYWKRAAYFWAFIAAAFTAYFLLTKNGLSDDLEPTYAVTCVGLVLSLAWYFVNRGSKAWQENWEMHVDLLEDAIMGPLYKRILTSHHHNFFNPTDAYGFSVSKINQILSLFVTAIWLFFLLNILSRFPLCDLSHSWKILTMTVITGVTIGLLFGKGRTDPSKTPRTVHVRRREYHQPEGAGGQVPPMLIGLIAALRASLLPNELGEVVIFGSSSIVLHGVPLGRKVDDLDVFVSSKTFDEMAKRLTTHYNDGKGGEKVPYLMPVEGMKIEILKSFLGVTFDQVVSRASVTKNSNELLVGSLEDAKLWKVAQDREKDQNDIKAIDKHLSRSD